MTVDKYVVTTNQGFTTRTSIGGKQRTTVECLSGPLVHNLDPRELGRGPAEAIAQLFKDRIAMIATRASDATIKARQAAARRMAQPDVQRRYAGGRMGPMPPNQSDRLFNDSGRLRESIVARAAQTAGHVGAWVVNFAANRLSPDTLNAGADGSSAAALERIKALLVQHVPEIANPKLLMDSLPVRRAIAEGQKAMIQKQSARIEELKQARAKAIVGLGRAVLGLVG